MTMYFTNNAPKSGPLLWRYDLAAIDVLRGPDDRSPIGRANPVGRSEGGIALWKLTVDGAALRGQWIVLGREFLPNRARPDAAAQGGGGSSCPTSPTSARRPGPSS
jgi:hypothetical protein